jgi:P4 family phage/plasmid primase-like protien
MRLIPLNCILNIIFFINYLKKNEIEKYHYIILTMNNTMINTSQNRSYVDFMVKHSAKNVNNSNETSIPVNITHTRIPNAELNVFPGSFIIPREELDTFYKLYYHYIFENDKKPKEYLTEKQLEQGGPIAVDFDFRYNYDVIERQHTKNHVRDMICVYLDELKEYYIFEENKPFPVYIFEKPNVNRLSDKLITKDGIHMIIGIQTDHTIQAMIREKMIQKLPEFMDLPVVNTWESVLDEGISRGTTNWQLFGSRKPGNEAYDLTHYYSISYDESDKEFMMDERKITEFDFKNNFAKLSVQYDKHPKFEMNPKIIDEYNKNLQKKNTKTKKASSKTKINLIIEDNDDDNEESISINDIKDYETLKKAVDIMLKNLEPNEYEIKETHEFTQALPPKYYEPGSHLLNRQVAFALKHTSECLFLSWVMLRSKASDFDYNTIPSLYVEWKKFHKSNQQNKSISKRSIMYWVKKENFSEYEKIKKNSINYYIEKSIETGTEYDLAVVLNKMYKDTYVCVSYEKRGIWYRFKNHRWIPDKGLSLRDKISKDLHDLIESKLFQLNNELNQYQGDENGDKIDFFKNKIKMVCAIKINLKKTVFKDHIMREASQEFYDEDFIKNMDMNKYLMCFNNGVIDFQNKIFRDGYPEDYITKTTRIDYIPYNESNPECKQISGEITKFMETLFPIPDLNRYMWDHLSSCLIGANKNQTFNVYHGSGSNGKSLLVDLMTSTLGDYKGTVPITLVTDARAKIGGTCDEILKLKGVRYAVMQEPSKGAKLNEGIMKELTGGDPILVRGLYVESEIFEPQFKLVVCTNNLFDITSNDDGTWRRIRKCTFPSKFVDKDENFEDDTPYVFPKDKSLNEKLHTFAPVFASMLVKRAFEIEGIVEDCKTVLEASRQYRNGQDHIAAYILDRIEKTGNPKDKVGKSGLLTDFKLWYQQEQGSRSIPKSEELYEVMNKKFGNCSGKKGWVGIRFIPQDEQEEDIINEI